MPNKYSTIAAFMDDLDPAKRDLVERVRSIVKEAHPGLSEHIKWNAPSYVLDGEDRVTFNLQNKEGAVKLVLHMGATRKEDKNAPPIMPDSHNLVAWQSDIRGVMSFGGLGDIAAKRAEVKDIIKRWLEIA